MVWFSYHGGHSGRYCRHAKGALADVVAGALRAGFTTYGLSEHCPRHRVEDLFPEEQDLSIDDLESMFSAYRAEAIRLRDEYADRLEILIGFETETVPPESWPQAMKTLRSEAAVCDYVVGSVHHVDGMCIDSTPEGTNAVAESFGGVEQLQLAYFELVAEVADELSPEVLGHIDLIRKFDPQPEFSAPVRAAIERALEAAKASGSALDVNAAPHRRGTGPVYPVPWILERACHMGVRVTLGDDSHGPGDVGVGLDACTAAIAAAGYREVHYLTKKNGAVEMIAAPLSSVKPSR